MSEIVLRDLELAHVPALASFAPENWRMALDAVSLQHFARSYFHARVAVGSDGLAAIAQGFVTGRAGWIGNVIVRPEARSRGLGTRMTRDMMDLLRGRGCTRLLLIATELGEPVYRKLGFRTTGEYVFLRIPRLPFAPAPSIRRLEAKDAGDVLRLDRAATGEERASLLEPHLASGWGHFDPAGALGGFFLPTFGGGLVVARRTDAGLELFEMKHALYPGNAVIPADNVAAVRFAIQHGGEEILRAPRMALEEDVAWRPDWIFGRATGYCG